MIKPFLYQNPVPYDSCHFISGCSNSHFFTYIDVKNISAVVPDLVRFECNSHNMSSVVLRKDNVTVSSVSEGIQPLSNTSTGFTATRFNDNWILFQLTRSEINDEGEYSCVVFNNTLEVTSRVYLLKVFCK